MVTYLYRAVRVMGVVLLVASGACDVDDPQRYERAPVIDKFQPSRLLFNTFVGDTVRFSVTASDPDTEALEYTYALGNWVVANTPSWQYIVDNAGPLAVTARVSDGSLTSTVVWHLQRHHPPPVPDTIPPAPVTIVSATRGQPGPDYIELIVWWIAVGDDSTHGRANHYDIRYADEPLDSEDAWSRASEAQLEPSPKDPGQLQFMVIPVPTWIGHKWVGVRAVDESGNISALGNTLAVETESRDVFGNVRHAVTNAPLAGIHVRADGFSATTGTDGRYSMTGLRDETTLFTVRDEDGAAWGDYFDIDAVLELQDGDSVDFWMLPNATLQTTKYPDFLTWFRQMTDTMNEPPNPLADNVLRTWRVPVDVLVPAFVHNGLDYQLTVKNAFNRWESWLGRDLFTFVDTAPDTGVSVVYSSQTSREHYNVPERDENWFPVKGRIWLRTIWSEATVVTFERIIAHEVGHALGMKHSTDPGHLMIGGIAQSVSEPTLDEVWLGKAMYNMPRGIPLQRYRWE